MNKTTNKYSPEVCQRAVRMVLDNAGQHESRWSTIAGRHLKAQIGLPWRIVTLREHRQLLDALHEDVVYNRFELR